MVKEIIGSLELNRIYQMDCLEGMRALPDSGVNLVVIDPPYNIGKDKRWDKWDSVGSYVEFMTKVFVECERVLKPNGSFYWFHNDLTQIRKLMDSLDKTSFIFKQFITWNKIDSSFNNFGYVQQRLSNGGMRNFYGGFTEYCLYYSLNSFVSLLKNSRIEKGMTQNDVDVAIGRVRKKNPLRGTELCRRWEEGNSFPGAADFEKLRNLFSWDEMYEEVATRFQPTRVLDDVRGNSNVWLYPPAPKEGHVTPKPLKMIENIIEHSSNEGDVILDCFMGSGTTAVASIKTGRKFIGFEREPEYVQIANRRLEAIQDTEADDILTKESE